jgi:hypothetical protein
MFEALAKLLATVRRFYSGERIEHREEDGDLRPSLRWTWGPRSVSCRIEHRDVP